MGSSFVRYAVVAVVSAALAVAASVGVRSCASSPGGRAGSGGPVEPDAEGGAGSGGAIDPAGEVQPLPPTTFPTTLPVTSFPPATPGTELQRFGDEIMVAGRLFRTGTRVVLWTDPGGYDAYRTERRFAPWAEAAFVVPSGRGGGKSADGVTVPEGQVPHPQRHGLRTNVLSWAELERVRGGGWPLELLQQKVDQFVLHYDVVGASKFCFKTLHDSRGLSVHFMLDVDGTIYQTLDVKERAFHATTSNYRSVGIEIANRGAFASDVPLKEFYARDVLGAYVSFPARFGDGGLLVPPPAPGYRPARPDLVRGSINGTTLVMYDLTPQQYDALARLTATLCTVLPRITLDYPKDARGQVYPRQLTPARLERQQGLIGHFHIQDEKYDPGPAFQWERVVQSARALMTPEALSQNRRASRSPVRAGALSNVPVRSGERDRN